MKHQAIQRELDSFLPGESGVITSVAKGDLAAKMAEMGIFLGKKVRVLYKAPFGGPIAVDLEGYTLSLRLDEAHLVAVVPANWFPLYGNQENSPRRQSKHRQNFSF